jgi:glycosyltransferase involved in cell wall biosynthesis/SAM-dependent methyltransferase
MDELHPNHMSHNSNEDQSLLTNLSPDDWAKRLSAGLTKEQIIQKIENRDYSVWAKFILDYTKPGQKVLELGSGTGEISGHLAFENRKVTLLDFSESMLHFSESMFKHFHQKIIAPAFCKWDCTMPLPFNPDAFDVVFSVGLLEHFDDEIIVAILKNVSKVTDGIIISLVPNANSTPYMMGKTLQEMAGTWKWGKEDPKKTLHEHYLKAGMIFLEETTIAPYHALRFVDEYIASTFLKWYEKMGQEELSKRKQGYLLAAVGSPLRAVNNPEKTVLSQKDHETRNNHSTSLPMPENHEAGTSQFSIENQQIHPSRPSDENQNNLTSQEVDKDQVHSTSQLDNEIRKDDTIYPSNENQNNDVSQLGSENQTDSTSQPANENHESITSQSTNEAHISVTKTLVVVPNDPLEAYDKAGYPDLTQYFNPGGYFDKVYCLSPWEKKAYTKFDMEVIPLIKQGDYTYFFKSENISAIRAYDFRAAHGLLQFTKIPEGIPFIVSVHDDKPERFVNISADRYIAMSNKVKQMLTDNQIPAEKVEVMPNRIDTNIFKPVENFKNIPAEIINKVKNLEQKMILCIGRWCEQKNQDTLLKALDLLDPSYFLVVIGRGYPLVPEPNTDVFDYPAIPNNQLPQWYSICDCFCLPSRWEGFGTVFIEAMACGAIVVTSNISPMNEYIQHNYNGILIDEYENPDAVAVAINDIQYLTPKRLADIRLTAIESAQHFSQLEVDTQEVEIYKSLIK